MVIELRVGADATTARAVLVDLRQSLENVRGTEIEPVGRLNGWRGWSANAPARARGQFTERTIRDLVLGPQFVMLQTMAVRDYGSGLAFLIDAEIEARLQALYEAIQKIDDAVRSWGRDRVSIILDTNVLLYAGPRITRMNWDDVVDEITREANFVVPIQVVEELDRQKDRGQGDARNNARFALKWLDEVVGSGYGSASFRPDDSDSNATIRVWVDDNERIPLAEVDRDIIDRALQLAPYSRKVIVASMDRSMVFRSRTYGLDAVLITEGQVPERATQ